MTNNPQPDEQTTHTASLQTQYEQVKAQGHQAILADIKKTEAILADLRLQKLLAEAPFSSLVEAFCEFQQEKTEISTTARQQLHDYLIFELLKPLTQTSLVKTDEEGVWQTKHFFIRYRFQKTQLTFEIKIPVTDARFDSHYLPLFNLDMRKMHATVLEKEVITLMNLWYSEKIFSRSQLSLINYDLNRLLANFKALDFDVKENFLDNTLELMMTVDSPVAFKPAILDQIFILLMDNPQYDLHKQGTHTYEIVLDHGQTIGLAVDGEHVRLKIDSNQRKRSILDFFTHYPFLVPLLIP